MQEKKLNCTESRRRRRCGWDRCSRRPTAKVEAQNGRYAMAGKEAGRRGSQRGGKRGGTQEGRRCGGPQSRPPEGSPEPQGPPRALEGASGKGSHKTRNTPSCGMERTTATQNREGGEFESHPSEIYQNRKGPSLQKFPGASKTFRGSGSFAGWAAPSPGEDNKRGSAREGKVNCTENGERGRRGGRGDGCFRRSKVTPAKGTRTRNRQMCHAPGRRRD